MKKYLFLVLIMLFSGCTYLRYPRPVTNISSVEQKHLYEAARIACNNIKLSWSEDDIDSINIQIGDLEDEGAKYKRNEFDKTYYKREIDRIDLEIYELNESLKNIENANDLFPKMKSVKLFIEINSDENRKYIFQNLIESYLMGKGITLVESEKEADLLFKIIVTNSGIDEKAFIFPIFYVDHKLIASVDLIAKLIDLKTKKVLNTYSSSGSAYYKQEYILFLGPFNSSSLDK